MSQSVSISPTSQSITQNQNHSPMNQAIGQWGDEPMTGNLSNHRSRTSTIALLLARLHCSWHDCTALLLVARVCGLFRPSTWRVLLLPGSHELQQPINPLLGPHPLLVHLGTLREGSGFRVQVCFSTRNSAQGAGLQNSEASESRGPTWGALRRNRADFQRKRHRPTGTTQDPNPQPCTEEPLPGR